MERARKEKAAAEQAASRLRDALAREERNHRGTVAELRRVNELLATKEGEDEAMARYKASLLGAAAAGQGKSEDPRRVVITQLAVVVSPARQLPT